MILARLKEETREQHHDLENTIDVLNQTFSLDDYRTLLQKFHRFYNAIEPMLAEFDWAAVGYDFNARLKTPKLESDLAHLGLASQFEDTGAETKLPDLSSIAAAFGAVYVLEGATLGGQIIKRHLREKLNILPENGGLFFSGYGEKTGMMWKEFGRAVTEFAEKTGEEDAIVAGAKDTFTSFKESYLTQIEAMRHRA